MMLRRPVRVAGRIAVLAAISWTLIPIAIADAPAPMQVAAASTSEPGESGGKQLFTVPEDGMGDTHWLSGATRLVRDILQKRPNEDLVICIAGCIASQGRVVYAQPTDPDYRAKDLVSDGAATVPAAKPPAAAQAEPETSEPQTSEANTPVAKTPEPEDIQPQENAVAAPSDAEPATPTVAADKADITFPEPSTAGAPLVVAPDSAPAIAPAAGSSAEQDATRLEFVPSMSVPNADEPAPEAAPTSEPAMEPPAPAPALE
jgi:hypothetical protein